MKKLLVALLAAMLVLCWCGSAMAAEEKTFNMPLTSDDVSIEGEAVDFSNVPKVEKVSDTEYKITAGEIPSFMKDENTTLHVNGDVYYDTKSGGVSFAIWPKDWEEKDGVYTYTFEVPEDLVPGTFSISQMFYTSNSDGYTTCEYHVNYREDINSSIGGLTQYDEEDGTWLGEYQFEDGELTYFNSNDVNARYEFGELYRYEISLDNNQTVTFDAYGELSSSWMYDQTLGHSVSWNSDGWYYTEYDFDTGETTFHYLDKAPEGAVDPETVEAPVAQPIPEFVAPTSNADTGMPAKAPVTAADLPSIASVEEKDGYWVVTLAEDLDKSDYRTDGYHRGSADVVVWYSVEEESYDSMNYSYSGVDHDGNTYYFPIPEEDAVLSGASVRFTIYDGKFSYDFTKDEDGAFYGNGSNDYDYYRLYASYDDGVLSYVSYTDPETFASSSWHFDAETAEVDSYTVPADKNLFITYLADGTVDFADYRVMEEDEDGSTWWVDSIYWDAETGWYTEEWDEETGTWIITPAEAPEGVKNPTQYAAPYVYKSPFSWYPHNTVGVLGLSLRDMYPNLTDKWYNIAPVDLTKEGTQTIPLAASNMYYFGEATVTVADGAVTVEYKLPGGEVFPEGECLQWFKSVDEITTEYLKNPTGGYEFGEAVSISEELGDQDVALLFICNRVTYRQPHTDDGIYLARFYPGQPNVKSWRAYLTELMTALEPEEAVEAAE